MKRLLLSSLLSCILIGQVSCCDAYPPITTHSNVAVCIASVAGVAGLITPFLVAQYTNMPERIRDYTKKHGIAEKLGITWGADAIVAAWRLSAAVIMAVSAVIVHITENETIDIAATSSALGAVISLACSFSV